MDNLTNLQRIEALYDCFAAKDFDRFRQLCHPELEWIQNDGFPGGGHRHGAQEVIEKVFMAFGDDWEEWRFDIDQKLEAGDSVVVLGAYAGRHRATGRAFRAAAAHVYDLEDGLITRFRQYTDTAMIVAAAAQGTRS